MGMMFGVQSGEERQYDFTGAGTVLLQSSEHTLADPHLVQQLEGQVGALGRARPLAPADRDRAAALGPAAALTTRRRCETHRSAAGGADA